MIGVKNLLLLSFVVLTTTACMNLNKNLETDVNVLQAKIANLEAGVIQLAEQNNELRDVIAGEQKRGEVLQSQVYSIEKGSLVSPMANQNADANYYNSYSKKTVTQSGFQKPYGDNTSKTSFKRVSNAAESTTGDDKFISDKMVYPPSVKDVQVALRNAGFYSGSIDGVAGSGSRKGVMDFQKNRGLSSDGIVGNQTWAQLKKFL